MLNVKIKRTVLFSTSRPIMSLRYQISLNHDIHLDVASLVVISTLTEAIMEPT